MSERTLTTAIVIRQCPDCSGVLTEQGILWSCQNPHPEAIATIEALAEELGITFTKHPEAFDLDTPDGAEWSLNGTYRASTAGITGAYGDLVRYRDRIASIQKRQWADG